MGTKKSITSGDTTWLDQFELSDQRRAFVLAYLETLNGAESARRAGYKQPDRQAHRLLRNDRIAAAITHGRTRIERAAMLDAEGVARMWADIATADPSELISNHIGPCRYCYGVDHAFQWTTEREFRDAYASAVYDLYIDNDQRKAAMSGAIEDPRLPTDQGGYGYRITDKPNQDCPECAGLGVEHVRMADTSKLKGPARLLYDGVEETRQGRKIRFQDRAKALDSLAKHLGMFSGKVEDETTSPLTRLAERIMANATSAPIRGSDAPEPGAETASPTHGSTPKMRAGFINHDPNQDGEDIEP